MATSEAATVSPRGSAKKETQAEKETQAGVRHLPGVPHLPGMPHVPGVHVPTGTAGRVLWWGGLATVAAFGVVDWPVAALIGAGSWVAEQYAKAARQPEAAGRKAS